MEEVLNVQGAPESPRLVTNVNSRRSPRPRRPESGANGYASGDGLLGRWRDESNQWQVGGRVAMWGDSRTETCGWTNGWWTSVRAWGSLARELFSGPLGFPSVPRLPGSGGSVGL